MKLALRQSCRSQITQQLRGVRLSRRGSAEYHVRDIRPPGPIGGATLRQNPASCGAHRSTTLRRRHRHHHPAIGVGAILHPLVNLPHDAFTLNKRDNSIAAFGYSRRICVCNFGHCPLPNRRVPLAPVAHEQIKDHFWPLLKRKAQYRVLLLSVDRRSHNCERKIDTRVLQNLGIVLVFSLRCEDHLYEIVAATVQILQSLRQAIIQKIP
mmetsp:Transcript_43439/g.94614  ORF Transcript_43439/g.94614 Transcript_43439/m.94614 type:complete len:210 (-) Transcript_43439:83-712(-)